MCLLAALLANYIGSSQANLSQCTHKPQCGARVVNKPKAIVATEASDHYLQALLRARTEIASTLRGLAYESMVCIAMSAWQILHFVSQALADRANGLARARRCRLRVGRRLAPQSVVH